MLAKVFKRWGFPAPLRGLGHVFKRVGTWDENQPRDNRGRFSSKGGAASALAAVHNKRDYTIKDVVSAALGHDQKTVDEYYAAVEEANALVKEGKTTKRLHSKNGDGTGGYTKERLKVHKAIVDFYLKDADNAKPENGEAPTFTILGGKSGSGKSNFDTESNPKFGVYSSKKSVVIDPDKIKEYIPEYDPSKAYLVHEESAAIADKILSKAKAKGLNVVMDITLRSPQDRMVNRFKKAGYQTAAHYMYKSPKGALTGAVNRWNRKQVLLNPITKEAHVFNKGRLVPPDVVEGNRDNEKNFDRIAGKVDNWSVVYNESDLGFQGRKVASKQKTKKGPHLSLVFKDSKKLGYRPVAAEEIAKNVFQVSHGLLDDGVYFVDGGDNEDSAASAEAAVEVPVKKAKLLEVDDVGSLMKFHSTNGSGKLNDSLQEMGFDGIRLKKPYTANASPWVVIYNQKVLGKPKVKTLKYDLLGFLKVFKAGNPYHDASGHFSSKEKAGHRVSQAPLLAEQVSGGYKMTQTQHDAAVGKLKENYSKALSHGATHEEVVASMNAKGVHQHLIDAMKDPISDAESKAMKAAEKYAKYSKTMLAKAIETDYPKAYADYQDKLAKHGANHSETKKALKNCTGWVSQAKKYGADDAKISEMLTVADEKYQQSKQQAGTVTAATPTQSAPAAQNTSKATLDDLTRAATATKYAKKNTKAETEAMVESLGAQYYEMKDKHGANHSKTGAAWAEWNKAKNDLKTEYGVSQQHISDMSGQTKMKYEGTKKKIEAAKLAKQTQVKTDLVQAGKDLAAGKKVDYSDLNKQAKDLGMTDVDIMNHLNQGGAEHVIEQNNKKQQALDAIKSASAHLHQMSEKHGDSSKEVCDAYYKLDSAVDAAHGMVTATEVKQAKKDGKEHYKTQKEALEKASKAFGDAGATAKMYDNEAQSFEWRSQDPEFAKHGKAQIAKLSKDEKDTITGYTGSDFTNINKQVGKAGTAKMQGKDHTYLSSSVKESVKSMDAVFQKTTLGKNTKLRRNMAQKYLWEQLGFDVDKVENLTDDDLEQLKGRVYKETAYSSTSMSSGFTGNFQGEASKTGAATLMIRAHKDTKGVNAKSISLHSGEDEVILPRGTTYVIRGVKRGSTFSGVKFVFDVDVIGCFPDTID